MDTREKIVEFENLPALLCQGKWTVISGFFDPLTLVQAERVARLAEPGRKLLAVVFPESTSLLESEARASLIAALRHVDAVVIADARRFATLCKAFPEVDVHEDLQAERRRSAEFAEFILRRQQSTDALN